MKKIYLLFVVAFATVSLMAQSALTISKDTLFVEGDINATLKAEFTAKNNTAAAIEITWELLNTAAPAGWDVYVCDPDVCYPPNIKTASFKLAAGATGTFLVDASPNGGVGKGNTRISIAAKGIAPQIVKIGYSAKVTSSNNDFSLQKISISPNPAQDFFTIQNMGDNVRTVQLTNLTGRVVASFEAQNGRFEIGNLPKGSYFVSFYNENNKRLGARKLIKAN
jgi:Secretion system C-terminal sorting domain